ncbi:MAG: DUF2339 domain-containing protein [Solirubrobacteraceae bacterium]
MTAAALSGGLGDGGVGPDTVAITAWLLAIAAVHLSLAGVAGRKSPSLAPLRSTAVAIAMVLIDVALAFMLHGLALTLAWGASALAIAAVRRHGAERTSDRALIDIGLAGHIALVLVRALLSAPPSAVGSGPAALAGVAAVAALAAICLASARTALDGGEFLPTVLALVGLASIGYLTAITTSGPALVSAWGIEAIALAGLNNRQPDPLVRLGSFAFLGAACGHVFAIEAPPWALLTGAADLRAAVLALASVAVATASIWRCQDRGSASARWMLRAVATMPLYLASVAIITVFQPALSAGIAVLDLSVQQQGQVLMSALWTVSGLVCLLIGLRRDLRGLRLGGLVLLLISAAKVFLYDLATLTSIYRVASFIVLGLLLLAGGFAYQRLRPPPLIDLRETTRAER